MISFLSRGRRALTLALAALFISAALSATPVPSGFGTQYSYTGDDLTLSKIAKSGFKHLRMVVNPMAVNWDRLAAVTLYLWAEGVTPLYILMDNPSAPPLDAAARDAFAHNSALVASAIQNLNPAAPVVWEIWNEPNGNHFWTPPNPAAYAELAYTTAVQLKQGVHHQVIAPAVGGIRAGGDGLNFLKKVFQVRPELLDYIDAVSVHGYGRTGREAPETLFGDYDAVSKYVASKGRARPIVLSEMGWFVNGGAAISSSLQAAYFTRLYLGNLLKHIPITIAYSWQAGPSSPEDVGTGFLDLNGTPRPAYAAVTHLFQTLAGYEFKHRIPTGSSDYALLFESANGSSRVAAWTTGNGHLLKLTGAHRWVTRVQVSQMPVYVDVPRGTY